MERIQMEVSETERGIILSYRKNAWMQPDIRKLLDVVAPEDKPTVVNLQKYITAQADGTQY